MLHMLKSWRINNADFYSLCFWHFPCVICACAFIIFQPLWMEARQAHEEMRKGKKRKKGENKRLKEKQQVYQYNWNFWILIRRGEEKLPSSPSTPTYTHKNVFREAAKKELSFLNGRPIRRGRGGGYKGPAIKEKIFFLWLSLQRL